MQIEDSPKCEKKEGIFQRYDKYRKSIKKILSRIVVNFLRYLKNLKNKTL